jgi:SPP1 family predicted phage head-tail adaptor
MKLEPAGFRNQRITLYAYNDIEDEAGGVKPVKEVYWCTKADVEILPAPKRIQAEDQDLRPHVKFYIRYRLDKTISDDMVVEWRGEMFTIRSVKIDFVYKRQNEIVAKGATLPKR